jgi:hypothetical protein
MIEFVGEETPDFGFPTGTMPPPNLTADQIAGLRSAPRMRSRYPGIGRVTILDARAVLGAPGPDAHQYSSNLLQALEFASKRWGVDGVAALGRNPASTIPWDVMYPEGWWLHERDVGWWHVPPGEPFFRAGTCFARIAVDMGTPGAFGVVLGTDTRLRLAEALMQHETLNVEYENGVCKPVSSAARDAEADARPDVDACWEVHHTAATTTTVPDPCISA